MKPYFRTALQPRALQAACWFYRAGTPGSTGSSGLRGPPTPGHASREGRYVT